MWGRVGYAAGGILNPKEKKTRRMNPATLVKEDNPVGQTLYMALELSNKTWKVVFGDEVRRRHVAVAAGALSKLSEAVEKAKRALR